MSLHDYHVVCSIHTSEHSVNIRTNSAFEKFNNCHFTIIMSCVESTIRKLRKKSCARVKWVPLHDYHVVCSIHTSEHSVKEHSVNIRTNSAFEKFNNCHFTIIMSCVDVESTIRKIRLSDKIGLRVTFAVRHTLFFIAWIKFEFFIIFWLRHVFTITFVIIRHTKNFSKYLS